MAATLGLGDSIYSSGFEWSFILSFHVGVHFQVVAYKELATFPSEWEVWKRLLQSVVSSSVWKSVLQVFKFQVLSSTV